MNEILLVVILLIVIFGIGFAVGVKHMSTTIKDVEKIQEKAAVKEIKKALKKMAQNHIEVIIVQENNTIYIYSPRRDFLQLEWFIKAYPMVEQLLSEAKLVKVTDKIGTHTIISYRPQDDTCVLPVTPLKELASFHEQLISIHHKNQ